MGKYEYIGKREIMRRVSALGYPVASGKLCSYAKFEGVEWLESQKLKVTVQRGGDWLQITQTRYNAITEEPERITRTYYSYSDDGYKESY
ncbi:hypothetical protein [Eshraghiella crossota]|uniref:hypothetical protein n=1 Tax=Eshraghiella crossota TaxID=45851 RepID=UPI0040270F77